ncbi:MAG: STAS domain-containing protein [Phycisphaerales bacterium]|nr:STAS domain-containing protein [Phycisphaerales bacterium]
MEFIPHEIDRDVFVLVADGGINRENAQQFTDDVEAMVRNGFSKLIIDCSKLEYISSTGLGTLLVLKKRMKSAGGDVKLCNVKGLVVQALQVIRLDRLFGIYPDLGQARLAFRPDDSSSSTPSED